MKAAIFFCDLTKAQIKQAKAWSKTENWAMGRPHGEHEFTFAKNIDLKVDGNQDNSNNVDNLTKDLLTTACFIYQADRMITRSQNWFRELEFHIGVYDYRLWNENASLLRKIIGHLTRDTVRIRFYKFQGKRAPLKLPRLIGEREGGICVFGDTLDAVAGAAIVNKVNAIVASYRYGQEDARSHHELIEQIKKLTQPLDYVRFRIIPRGLNGRDPTQRTNGFLQLALAGAVARSIGLDSIGQLQVFGNGIASYHLQNRQLCGSGFSVRDTHPLLLKLVQELFRNLFSDGENLCVVNQFQYLTPSAVLNQVLETLNQADTMKLFAEISNCSERRLARSFGRLHCGCCFSCKIRRLAALNVKFEQAHDHSNYATDPLDNKVNAIFKSKLNELEKKTVYDSHETGFFGFKRYIEGFRRSPAEIRKLTEVGKGISDLATELLDVGGPRTSQDMENEIIALHKQFADETKGYI
jgi:hypothetical protein